MVYCPPLLEDLERATDLLESCFNEQACRYISPSFSDLCTGIKQLETSYKKEVATKKSSRWFFTPEPTSTRLEQITFIAQVLSKVLESYKGNLVDNQARLILEGALMYRDVRIEKSYDIYLLNQVTDNRSVLSIVIKKVLGVNHDNQIDPYTLAMRCNAYRNFLKKNVNDYPYITKDCQTFFANLDAIIAQATKLANPLNVQLMHVFFIQTLQDALRINKKPMMDTLNDVIILLKKETRCLKISSVIPILSSLKSANATINLLKHLIIPCLDVDAELQLDKETDQLILIKKENSETISYDFKELISQDITTYWHCALLGIYIMTLESCTPNDPLYNLLQFTLRITSDNCLDLETTQSSLEALQVLVTLLDAPLIDSKAAQAFGGLEQFKAKLTRLLIDKSISTIKSSDFCMISSF